MFCRIGIKIRGSLVMTIYKKLMKVSVAEMAASNFTKGEIINFMSTDTDRIVNFCPSFHDAWGLPLQLAIALYLLYREVGLAFLAGVGFAILLVPVNKWITNKIGQLSTEMMLWKDKRVNMMTELLMGIRVVKLSGWEAAYSRKIHELREMELKYLKGRKYLDAGCVYLWASAPSLIALFTFITYSLMGNQLTAPKVFTTLSLMSILIRPLNAFPWVLNGLVEAWVSLKRLQKLFRLNEIDRARYYVTEKCRVDVGADMCIHNAEFSWVRSRPCLSNLSLGFGKGHLIGICGPVGAGKSTLFAGICGELFMENGQMFIDENDLEDGFAYVAQESWLQQGSVRENILFGRPFDAEFYAQVVRACALLPDFDTMPEGDETEVGESGTRLSGGQRARIALARAVYQDKQYYLLDDPLSAVDMNVAEFLFQACIQELLLNRDKIVLLATHHTQYMSHADFVVVLSADGNIETCGPPNEIIDFDKVIRKQSWEFNISESLLETTNNDEMKGAESAGAPPSISEPVIVQEEQKETGSVEWKVYVIYAGAVGGVLSVLIFLALAFMQGSKNVTDWWLAYWVSHSATVNVTSSKQLHRNSPHFQYDGAAQALPLSSFSASSGRLYSHPSEFIFVDQSASLSAHGESLKFYMMIYGILTAGNTIFTLARAFLFAYGGIVAARKLHNRLLSSILKAQLSFFDQTPVGRLINRFSSDHYSVDETLPFQGNIFLMFVFGVVGTLIMICYGLPWFIVAVIFLAIIYYFIQDYYRHSTCDLKRISSISLSPIYVHYTDTINGIQTIRAFRADKRFIHLCQEYLTGNLRAQYSNLASTMWLGVRLQTLAVVIVTIVALIAVLQRHLSSVNPGLVGLAISYALSVTGILSGLLSSFTETEKELVSVERIDEYTKMTPPENVEGTMKAPSTWPSNGDVQFRGVTLRYNQNAAPALIDVTFSVKAGKRLGIIGRTGSGKSSLIQALFRAVEVESGSVLIDGLNVAGLNLNVLRSKLSIIPQSPFLITGSLRDNLDIFDQYHESEISATIDLCGLGNVRAKLGGMNESVGEVGSYLSVGERQLVCLGRALLKRAKVVCIDEATAHVDSATDQEIQKVLRDSFGYATVLTIAHRLETVGDYDQILVMEKGRVKAIGPPREILPSVD